MNTKKFLLILSAVLFITFSVYSVVSAGEKKIKFSELPKNAQNFYSIHFGSMEIKTIGYDKHKKSYEIELWNKHTITFNQKGEWTEINCDSNSVVPESVIESLPTDTMNQLLQKYKGNLITKIERVVATKQYKIEIVLPDGSEKEVEL